MFFHSYKEAHQVLHLKGSFQRGTIGNTVDGITSLKLTENPRSYDRIQSDFERILYVGIGKKSSQGEPAVDQHRQDQEPFFVSLRNKNPFPVLMKLHDGLVFLPGYYTVKSIKKKTSPGNISYYEIELQKSHAHSQK